MLSINVTFNGNTNALADEIYAGPAAVALRILYKHFISGGGAMNYCQFFRMCHGNWHGLTIVNALDVVIRDIGRDINFIVLGIDELNCLHNLALEIGEKNIKPVQVILKNVGSLSTSEGKIFYAPILAGTIQGPLENMIKSSTYGLLRLPLRLLCDEEVRNISLYMAQVQTMLKDYIDFDRTLHRCISDIGGQVRALEIFYRQLLTAVDMEKHGVDYKLVMQLVRHDLMEKYPFKDFVSIMKPVVAHAILNIPVEEIDEFDTFDGKKSYIDLSSEGVISLEMIPDNPGMSYVRMPYVWVWILTSLKDFEEGKFWDVMIDQESHILWQTFEDFNVRFWILRLQLLKVLYKEIKVRDLLRGAYHVDNCPLLDYEFQLPTVKEYYVELENRFPENVKIKDLSPGTMYKNGKGAPCADHFFFLGDLLVFVQDKSSDATAKHPQTLSKGMIETEYGKAKDGYKQFKKFDDECPIERWVLFICSNGPRTSTCLESLPENCFVVDRESFNDFYGYTFSTRAEFSAGMS